VDGNAVVLWYDSGDQELRFEKDSDGDHTIWAHAFPVSESPVHGNDLIVAPGGDLYLHVITPSGFWSTIYIDLGGGRAAGALVARYTTRGEFVTNVTGCGQDCNSLVMAVSATGERVELHSASQTWILLVHADGTTRMLAVASVLQQGTVLPDGAQYGPAAFDHDGNILLAGAAFEPVTILGQDIGEQGRESPFLLKLDSKGDPLWVRALSGIEGSIGGLGVSALGTVVASGGFVGQLDWGSGHLSHPGNRDNDLVGFLLTAEKDGQPRWARQIEPRVGALAVDPSGRAAVAGTRAGCGEPFVQVYNLAGDALWERSFPGVCAGASVHAASLPDHGFLIGGTFTGNADFGLGPVISQKLDGFIVDLAP